MFKSRFGYHPCSYKTFLKLKTLHKFYWETVRKLSEWLRWNAKEPQNRILKKRIRDENGRVIDVEKRTWEEPKFCPMFGKPEFRRSWLTIPDHIRDLGIIAAYKNAKTPKSEADVVALMITEEAIEDFYNQMKLWQE